MELTIKQAESRRIDAFELWCWRRHLRVPWTARRSNQSILKEISPEYSLEEPMLKLKRQYLATWCKELTHWKRAWCWEKLKVGGDGDDRGWDGWMASPTQWAWVWANSGSWWWTGRPGVLQSMGSQRVKHAWAELTEWNQMVPGTCVYHRPDLWKGDSFAWIKCSFLNLHLKKECTLAEPGLSEKRRWYLGIKRSWLVSWRRGSDLQNFCTLGCLWRLAKY